jgi:hypothetical protein
MSMFAAHRAAAPGESHGNGRINYAEDRRAMWSSTIVSTVALSSRRQTFNQRGNGRTVPSRNPTVVLDVGSANDDVA